MIRGDNLALMIKQRGLTHKDVALAIGYEPKSSGRIGKLIKGKVPFYEDTARRIEEEYNLPYKWLDEVHDGADYSEESKKEIAMNMDKHLAVARAKEAELAAQPLELSIQSRRIARALDEISDSAKRSEIAMVLLDIIDDLKGKT
jgi:transcriptional regulator with XRE-family HTH domain